MRLFFLFLVLKSPVWAISEVSYVPELLNKFSILGSEASEVALSSSSVVSGEVLGIISILIAILTGLLWFLSLNLAIFATLPLGILGLTLGLLGRKKARKWRQGRRIKRLCNVGIFLNILTSSFMLLLILAFAFYSKGQH